MGRFRAFGVMAVGTALAFAASSFVVGATAQAAPVAPLPTKLDECHMSFPDHSHGISKCTAGTGEQRMTSKCVDGHGSQARRWTANPGQWVGRGQSSQISCGTGDHVSGKIEYR